MRFSTDFRAWAKVGRVLVLSLVLVGLSVEIGQAQRRRQANKSQLERRRQENQKRIEEVAKILEQTSQEKEATIGKLNAINDQVKSREQNILTISRQISLVQDEIFQNERVLDGLSYDLKYLRDEYARMVYAASKTDVYSRLLFLISAKTFNEFVRRLEYLKQYSSLRRKQAEKIESTRKSLRAQRQILEQKKAELQVLLDAQVKENEEMLNLVKSQRDLVSKLKRREKEIKRELKERQEADRRMDRLIEDLVRREMREAARKARARAKEDAKRAKEAEPKKEKDKSEPKKESPQPLAKTEEGSSESASTEEAVPELTPEAALISKNFASNKGRLGWPVESGFISQSFGIHPHPVYANYQIQNLGIDIQTRRDEKIRAVFDGEVSMVATIPGMPGKMVAITHGQYFTVYTNLADVNVSTGDKVKAKDILGNVYTDPSGTSILNFQIWRETNKLNPESWLRRK